MSLRQKLALGFGGLLVIIAAIGIHNITRITALGQSIDVILRENYRSVIACQEMKEALERMDSGAVFVLLGAEQKGNEQIAQNDARFEKALQVELGNITLPGEGEKAERLKQLFGQFRSDIKVMGNPAFGREARRKAYFDDLLPLFQRMKDTADDILRMNQENMVAMDARARRQALSVRGQMYMMLLAATIVAAGFLFLTGKWILRPITRLTNSAKEIRKGNLDLVVPGGSSDEIGQLYRGVRRYDGQPAGIPANRPGQAPAYPAFHPAGIRQLARCDRRDQSGGRGGSGDRGGEGGVRFEIERPGPGFAILVDGRTL